MSPEQATADKEITGRSDIYSLGSVLYEMLAGEPPHMANSAQQIIMKILTDAPRPVTELRKSVPPNVAAAVAIALEKLPADRFDSAAKFADALKDPGFTRPGAAGSAERATMAGAGAAVWRPVALAATTVAVGALLALAWSLSRAPGPGGPTEYDVGLAAAAPRRPDNPGVESVDGGIAVDPAGAFVVYQVLFGSTGELWYRSLRDATTRRVDGTEGAWNPAISPDGTRLAFLREGDPEPTVEIVPLEGGDRTTLARVGLDARLQWLADGRILVVDGDGNRARWLEPGGVPAASRRIPYCILAAPLPDPNSLLCGGGGDQAAYRIAVRDSTSVPTPVLTDAQPPTPVFGSNFRVIDERYLVWLSKGADLLAAPIDLESGRVGRSVRMATGLGRQAYSGAGTYDISATGTLVYANAANQAVGSLVSADGTALDTLPVGREAFLRFNMSPDRQRLAAVVEVPEGEELRVYDLRTGEYIAWQRHSEIRQPVWSPNGDRITFQAVDSVFVGSPDAAGAPEFLFWSPDGFEGFDWLPGDRVFGILWEPDLVAVAHLDRRPVTLDTLFGDASIIHPSPDGRWITYASSDFTTLWLEPLPRTGKRYQLRTGGTDDGQWLSPSELVLWTGSGFARATIDPVADPPLTNRRPWIETHRMIGTAGQSYSLTPDGRLLYVQGAEPTPVTYLRVVPDWVARMKRAVDEANR
jgi:serine/threonine-protein kinase